MKTSNENDGFHPTANLRYKTKKHVDELNGKTIEEQVLQQLWIKDIRTIIQESILIQQTVMLSDPYEKQWRDIEHE